MQIRLDQLTITADVSSDEGRVTESHAALGQIRLLRVTQLFWTDHLLLFYKNYRWTWHTIPLKNIYDMSYSLMKFVVPDVIL